MMGSSLTHIGWKVPAAFDCAVVHTPVCPQIYIYACTILHMFSSGHVERETSVQRQQVHEHAILVLTLQVPVSHPARVPCPYCLSHLPRHKCLDSANIRKVS